MYIINWLSPGGNGYDFKCVNFKQNLGLDSLSIQVNITAE